MTLTPTFNLPFVSGYTGHCPQYIYRTESNKPFPKLVLPPEVPIRIPRPLYKGIYKTYKRKEPKEVLEASADDPIWKKQAINALNEFENLATSDHEPIREYLRLGALMQRVWDPKETYEIANVDTELPMVAVTPECVGIVRHLNLPIVHRAHHYGRKKHWECNRAFCKH